MRLTANRKKELMSIAIALRKSCHAKSCPNRDEKHNIDCPESFPCKKFHCQDILTPYTTKIAWLLAPSIYSAESSTKIKDLEKFTYMFSVFLTTGKFTCDKHEISLFIEILNSIYLYLINPSNTDSQHYSDIIKLISKWEDYRNANLF